MAKKTRTSKGRTIIKALLVLLGIVVACVLVLVGCVRSGVFGKLPTTNELAALRNEEATLILASNGAVIGKVFAKDRTNIRYRDLPRHLIDALVATEDQRFFTHGGVDAWSYVRVLFRTIIGGDRGGGGGSTISQQIIKNLYGRERHGLLTVPVNKIKEAIVARRLELVYTKEDVLALYLNSVPFGENLFGVESAAQRFFGKSTPRLRVEEAAVLVGMLKANTAFNPRLYPERSRGRRDQVLGLMGTRGYLSPARVDSLSALPLALDYHGLDAFDAYGYFTARVESEARRILAGLSKHKGSSIAIEKDGLRIHTTLDTALQGMAIRAARGHLSSMQVALDRELRLNKARYTWEKGMARKGDRRWKKNLPVGPDVFRWDGKPGSTLSYRDSLWHYHRMLHGAVLVMEPANGSVRAWVGGNDHRSLPYDLVTAKRPIASTIKPVLYAAALESGLDPCTYLDNTERVYADYDDWHPRNFGDSSGGQVAMWYALAHSMNLPTVDLYFRTSPEELRATFRALGLPQEGVDNPALALGAADISLEDIVHAYAAFADGGRTTLPVLIDRITDAHGRELYRRGPVRHQKAVEPVTAATITAMLERAVNEGTGAALRSRFHVRGALAGKTGTSQDFGDAWFVAYTPGLVIGTWVGAFDPTVHFAGASGAGSKLALPIAANVLANLERVPALRKRYFQPFGAAVLEVDLGCEGTRPMGITGFLDDLFKGRAPAVHERDTTPQEEKPGFWRRLFPKKPR